jgi:hypothetical protein
MTTTFCDIFVVNSKQGVVTGVGFYYILKKCVLQVMRIFAEIVFCGLMICLITRWCPPRLTAGQATAMGGWAPQTGSAKCMHNSGLET